MKIMYVDDEQPAIAIFREIAAMVEQIKKFDTFTSSHAAISYFENNPVDVAFLDMEMPVINGIELAKRLQTIDKNIKIVFVTAYEQYAFDAFGVDAIGYLLKPYTVEMLTIQLEKASRIKDIPQRRVHIRTFPNFDVFIDDELVTFGRPKVKELLAFFVDKNGTAPTTGQVIAALWEDRPDDSSTSSLYRTTFLRLKELLESKKIEYIISGSGVSKYINKDMVSCDYYDFLTGETVATASYHGEYMSEYTWAENTNARLTWQIYGIDGKIK